MPSVENHGRGESGWQRSEPGKVFWGGGAGSTGRMGSDAARSCSCCHCRLRESKFPRQLLGAVQHALCKVSCRAETLAVRALPAFCSPFGNASTAQGGLIEASPAVPLGDLVLVS